MQLGIIKLSGIDEFSIGKGSPDLRAVLNSSKVTFPKIIISHTIKYENGLKPRR